MRRSGDAAMALGAQRPRLLTRAAAGLWQRARHRTGHSTGDTSLQGPKARVRVRLTPGPGSLAETPPRRLLRLPLSSRHYLGERGLFTGPLQRWLLPFGHINQEGKPASPPRNLQPSGCVPAPPASPAPPPLLPALARASLRLCAPLALPCLASPLSFRIFSSAPPRALPGWKRKTQPLVRKFGLWTSVVPGRREARLQPVPRPPVLAARPLALPPSRRRSRGSLLHADPGRRRWRALRADAGTQASLLSGCCSTSSPSAGALKSFVPLRLDRLLILRFWALRFTQEPQYRSPHLPPSFSNLWMRLCWQI